MKKRQEGISPVIAREGLMQLVAVVERLRSREDEGEGRSLWKSGTECPPESGPDRSGRSGVVPAAPGEPAGRGAVAGGAGGTAAVHEGFRGRVGCPSGER